MPARYRSHCTLVALALAVTLSAGARPPNDTQNSSSSPIPLFQPGADVSAPAILPLSENFDPPKHCKDNLKSRVLLGAIIDTKGRARNLRFLNPAEGPDAKDSPDLDKLALLVANADRFQPATHAGAPVAVAQAIELRLIACVLTTEQDHGIKLKTIHLKAQPLQTLLPYPDPPHAVLFGDSPVDNENPAHGPWRLYKVGKDATAPKLLRFVEAHFSGEALRKKIEGTVVLSLVVDSNGLPRKIKVERSMGLGLDENAVAAVSAYRFSPALHNNQPVAAPIRVEVNFRFD